MLPPKTNRRWEYWRKFNRRVQWIRHWATKRWRCHAPVIWRDALKPLIILWARNWMYWKVLWRVAIATLDLRLPSYSFGASPPLYRLLTEVRKSQVQVICWATFSTARRVRVKLATSENFIITVGGDMQMDSQLVMSHVAALHDLLCISLCLKPGPAERQRKA